MKLKDNGSMNAIAPSNDADEVDMDSDTGGHTVDEEEIFAQMGI